MYIQINLLVNVLTLLMCSKASSMGMLEEETDEPEIDKLELKGELVDASNSSKRRKKLVKDTVPWWSPKLTTICAKVRKARVLLQKNSAAVG